MQFRAMDAHLLLMPQLPSPPRQVALALFFVALLLGLPLLALLLLLAPRASTSLEPGLHELLFALLFESLFIELEGDV
jgi:hypothetical protein